MEGITIRPEEARDVAAREAILDAAMGPDRRRKSSERIREGRLPAPGLALVAEEGGAVIGTVRLWEARAGRIPLLLLGPLAVRPDAAGGGVGSGLVRAALETARTAGHGAVVLVGDPGYYGRFGFSAIPAAGLAMPGPFERHRLLALELAQGSLDGAAGVVCAAGQEDSSETALAA